MPVQADNLDDLVIPTFLLIPAHDLACDHQKVDHAGRHVNAVETGDHEEGRAKLRRPIGLPQGLRPSFRISLVHSKACIHKGYTQRRCTTTASRVDGRAGSKVDAALLPLLVLSATVMMAISSSGTPAGPRAAQTLAGVGRARCRHAHCHVAFKKNHKWCRSQEHPHHRFPRCTLKASRSPTSRRPARANRRYQASDINQRT